MGDLGSLCHSAIGAEIRNFKAGKVLFATINFGQILNTVKDMDEQYTFLPYPMYDVDQGIYLSGLHNIVNNDKTATDNKGRKANKT